MLHTSEVHCSLALWIKQFKPERSNCIKHMYSGLHTGYHTLEYCISSKIWPREYPPNLDRRITRKITGE